MITREQVEQTRRYVAGKIALYFAQLNQRMEGSFVPPTAIPWMADEIATIVAPSYPEVTEADHLENER